MVTPGTTRLKACPKCGGDMCLTYEGDWGCLQCGYYKYATTIDQYLYLRGVDVLSAGFTKHHKLTDLQPL